MARGEPNTATNHFFICVNTQPSLDFGGKRNPDGFGFAAFGKVIEGLEIVKKIQNRENEDQSLLKPVIIKNIKRIE
jgi:peptidyl-prolyl cis-trans isomerase A (cyclophilin A)